MSRDELVLAVERHCTSKLPDDDILEITAPKNVARYVILKGSIAIDGISLTVAGVGKKSFCVWIIPHTFEVTALRERKVGGAVNLGGSSAGVIRARPPFATLTPWRACSLSGRWP